MKVARQALHSALLPFIVQLPELCFCGHIVLLSTAARSRADTLRVNLDTPKP